jgi:hypothetical protein
MNPMFHYCRLNQMSQLSPMFHYFRLSRMSQLSPMNQ